MGLDSRLQPATARAVSRDGLGERGGSGDPPDQARSLHRDRPQAERDRGRGRGGRGDLVERRRWTRHRSPAVQAQAPGETSVLVGSSGVGKSTIINRLLGQDAQKTRDVREDDSRGRHTTSHRELFVLPGRLAPHRQSRASARFSSSEGRKASSRLSRTSPGTRRSCRFSDCTHRSEPSCAVLAAVAEGALSEERLESYRALRAGAPIPAGSAG